MDQSVGPLIASNATGFRSLFRHLGRRRVQLLGGLLVATAFPYYMRLDLGQFGHPNQINSLVAVTVAVLIGYYLFRQLTKYPGIISTSYIFPTFVFSYGLMLTLFFFLRIDYSRLFFAVSFINAQLWFHLAHIASKRATRLVFDVVPFGNAKTVTDVDAVDWVILNRDRPRCFSKDGLVADLRHDLTDEWESLITETAISGTPVYHYKQIKEMLTGRVDIEHLSENNLGSLLPDIIYLRFKHWADVGAALLLSPFLLPLIGVIAMAVRLLDGGPVFFGQTRMGYRGKTFTMWKFRTMRPQVASVDSVEAATTVEDDQRVTRIGRFLRKTRLDELPQIINILRGEMSWIGPRPEAVSLSRLYESKLPFYRYRHIVRPGITGWAQVNQGHVAAVDEVLDKLHYDFYYVKNFSVWLDMLITLRTLRVILTGHGAK